MAIDTGPPPRRLLRIGLAPDSPVVTAGARAVLRAVGHTVVDVGAGPHGQVPAGVDIVLYDPQRTEPPAAHRGPGRAVGPRLVAWSWSLRTDVVTQAREQGAVGFLSKELPASVVLASLHAHAGGGRTTYVVAPPARRARSRRPDGLTAREVEILEMICEGYSNDEIAARLYLSINSVKTYVRTAYRKIGATRRPQAVLWGVENGLGRPREA